MRLVRGFSAAFDYEAEDWSQYRGRSFQDENGDPPFRAWRKSNGWDNARTCEVLGVSQATLYRIDSGLRKDIVMANLIVQATRGEIRYRDLIPGFRPEYA